MREVLRREHPEAVVSISSEVLREYREYERSMTTLVDAAVKPKVSRYVANIKSRLDDFTGEGSGSIPFYIMKSNGGVLSADEVVHQPITTVLSGPAAGALGAALIAGKAGFDKVLTCDGGGTSTDVSVVLDGEPTLTTEGTVGRYPSKIPMIDVVTVGAGGGSIAWISPGGHAQGRPPVGRRRPGPDLLRPRAAPSRRSPTPTSCSAGSRRTCSAARSRWTPTRPAPASRTSPASSACAPSECAAGILEISAWNQANALRQITVKRGLDVRDFMLATFGGSGSLLAVPARRHPRPAPVSSCRPNPGNVSAFGLLTVDVKNDYVQTAVRQARPARPPCGRRDVRRADRAGAPRRSTARASPRADHRYVRTADLRYFGQAFEVRVTPPDGRDRRGRRRRRGHRVPRRPPGPLRLRLPRRPAPAGRVGQPAGHRHRPDHPARDHRDRRCRRAVRQRGAGPHRHPPGLLRPAEGYVDTGVYWRPDLRAGDEVAGPAIVEEFGSTVPSTPASPSASTRSATCVITKESAK